MSMKLDTAIGATGTKFRIFPQPRFLPSFTEPETIRVSVTPASIQAGPADDRMYVLDAIDKVPYSRFFQRPYSGDSHPPVQPGKDGHFDHLDVDKGTCSSWLNQPRTCRSFIPWSRCGC